MLVVFLMLTVMLFFCREFDPSTKSLLPVPLPWPVVWLMSRFNRKHTLCPGSAARPEHVLHDLVQFDRRPTLALRVQAFRHSASSVENAECYASV